MSKALEVGDVLSYFSDGPWRLAQHLINGGGSVELKSERGVIFEMDSTGDFNVISGDDDGFPPAELTVVSVG